MNRRGVALLTVMWVLAALGTAAALGLRAVRDGAATAQARVGIMRARWRAEGCLALLRAALDRALRDGRDEVWRDPSTLVVSGCPFAATAPADGPVYLATATAERLATLPGFTPDAVAIVIDRRAWGGLRGLDQLLEALPMPLREGIAARYAEVAARLVFEPRGWEVVATGTADPRDPPAMMERWARGGARVAVVRREVW
jgi:type II secretory pathway component PulK